MSEVDDGAAPGDGPGAAATHRAVETVWRMESVRPSAGLTRNERERSLPLERATVAAGGVAAVAVSDPARVRSGGRG